MSHHTESEFKLRATQPIETAAVDALLRELGATCRTSSARHHTDTYLDDDRGSLLRAGVGLRLRAGGGKRLLTCKTSRKDDGRLFVRDEIETAWLEEELPADARNLPDELREAVQPFVQSRALAPQQTLQVQREIRVLTDGDKDLCELAIDFVEAHANEHKVSFQEIELEVLNNVDKNEQLAKQLQERLPVEFAKQDKPAYAAALLGIEAPIDKAAEDLAMQPLAESIPAQLQQLHERATELEHAVREVGHHSTVTEMQTTLERQDVLLRAFADLWPAATTERMRNYLRTTHRHLGSVRELHALLDSLRTQTDALPTQLQDARQAVIAAAERERDVTMDRLSEWLADPLRDKTRSEFDQDTREVAADAPDGELPLLHAAPPALTAAVTALREQLAATDRDLPANDANSLRVALQNVHHLAEQFADLPGASYKKSVKAVARVLRHVVRVCDAETTMATLLQWVEHGDDSSEQRYRAAALGGLATLHAATATEAREVTRDVLERLDRDPVWRRFAIGAEAD